MLRKNIKGAATMAHAIINNRVRYMILHVTTACNARCRMCFNWDRMQEKPNPRGMALEAIERMADSMKLLPQLTCSGGEPLLRSDLHEIIKAFYHKSGTRFFTVPTNCQLPQRVAELITDFTKNCPGAYLNFCLPFHGTGKDFDEILGVPNAFGKFNETYAIIQEAIQHHENISCLLNFVMSKFNADSFKQIIDTALDMYPDAPLGIAYARGITKERDAVEVPLEIYRKAQDYLSDRRRNLGHLNPYTIIFSSISKQMADLTEQVVKGEKQNLRCGGGRRFLVVYENGMVYPCEMLDVQGVPDADAPGAPQVTALGDLADYDYDMQGLLNSQQAQQVMQWINRRGCVCTWECAIYSTLAHSPLAFARIGANAIQYVIQKHL